MGLSVLVQVAKVRGPQEADANGEGGEICLSVSGTAVKVTVPEWLKGKYAEVTAVGAACDFVFGDSSVDCVYNEASTVTSTVITTNDTTGRHVPDGATRTFIVPIDKTHMSVEASGAGFFYLSQASVAKLVP